MSEHPVSPPAGPATSSAAMVRTLGLVASICGILIVTAYQGTLERVAANKRVALERAVSRVIPGAASMRAFVASPSGIAPAADAAGDGVRFFAAYDAAGRLKGIAAEAAAMGYADTVRVLYAYDPARQAITGLVVVAQRETPGIGDKILTAPAFLANFAALDVRLNADLSALANAVRTVRHGRRQHPWEIDAIAGATVTCRAVGRGINDSAQRLLPLLVADLDRLGRPADRQEASP